MNKDFKEPNFNGKHIEIRRDDNDVEVIATKIGLEKLIDLCRDLINNPHQGHIHLEDYDVLTNESLKGTLVLSQKEVVGDIGGSEGSGTSLTK